MDERDRDEDKDEIVMFLERDQLVSDRRRPLGRATLGRGSQVALWGLRIFVRSAGTFHTPAARSNSVHVAWRSSPGRGAKIASSCSAAFVVGWP